MAKTQAFFISPHLDDAAFSAGALMSRLAKTSQVTVATVFTQSGGNHTLSAKQYLLQCQTTNAKKLYKSRRIEDKSALQAAGIKVLHLGYTEALWRTIPGRRHLLLPELYTVYPTYRLHIARSAVSPHDEPLISSLAIRLKLLVKDKNAPIFCPVGHGHIDHLVTRLACERAFGTARLTFWLDFPYSLRTSFDSTDYTEVVPANLSRRDYAAKLKLAKAYLSQYPLVIASDQQLLGTAELYLRPNYALIHSITPAHQSGYYTFALTQTPSGKQLFTKSLGRDSARRHRKWLDNEQVVYRALSNLRELGRLSQQHKLHILKSYVGPSSQKISTLYLEYMPGKTIANSSAYSRAVAHNSAISLLGQVSRHLQAGDKASIIARPPLYWLLSLPYLFLASLLRRPDLVREITVATLKVIVLAKPALKRPHHNLVHRDLNFNSFICKANKLYLIDFQLSSIGDPIIDYAVVVNKFIEQKSYLHYLIASPVFQSLYKSLNGPQAFNFYLLILSLYNLLIPHGTPRTSELILRHFYLHNSIISL